MSEDEYSVYTCQTRPVGRGASQRCGDVIGYGLIVTPEREKEVLFTAPIDSNVKLVIVTGPKVPPIASAEDLSGKKVYINPAIVVTRTCST